MKIITRKRFRLAVRWTPGDGLIADLTPRFGNGDLRYIFDVFDDATLAQLASRGYDLSTLRFQIDKTPAAVAEHEKLAGRAPAPAAGAAGGRGE